MPLPDGSATPRERATYAVESFGDERYREGVKRAIEVAEMLARNLPKSKREWGRSAVDYERKRAKLPPVKWEE